MGIKVLNVKGINDEINIKFKCDENLKKYFNSEEFFSKYDFNVEKVPSAIKVIPFVSNILPLIWLEDTKLYIEELDRNFYLSLEDIKKGYKNMYPYVEFKGDIVVDKLIDTSYEAKSKSCMFFSGGMDSLATLVNRVDEKPDLITLWGADVAITNIDAWNRVKDGVTKVGKEFDLKNSFIKSNFRSFFNYKELDGKFRKILKDSWWHGIQHGIGLIGQAVPYVYSEKMSRIYIPATDTFEGITCASHPTIDEKFKVASMDVIHEGVENKRIEKARLIGEYLKNKNLNTLIRVCWRDSTGINCGKCEKCMRSLLMLLAYGINPSNHGFDFDAKKTLKNIKREWNTTLVIPEYSMSYWEDIQRVFIEKSKIEDLGREYKWILNINFASQRLNNIKYKKLKKYLKKITSLFSLI